MIAACVFAAKIGTMIICSPSLVAIWGHSRQQGMQSERSLKPFALQWTAGKAKTRREWCHAVLSCVSGDTRRHKHVHDGNTENHQSHNDPNKYSAPDSSGISSGEIPPGLEDRIRNLPDLWWFERQDKVGWGLALSCVESWPPKNSHLTFNKSKCYLLGLKHVMLVLYHIFCKQDVTCQKKKKLHPIK